MSRQSVYLDKKKSSDLTMAIRVGMTRKRMTQNGLAELMQWAPITLSRKLRTPDNFTRGELKTLIAILEIPAEEILPYII